MCIFLSLSLSIYIYIYMSHNWAMAPQACCQCLVLTKHANGNPQIWSCGVEDSDNSGLHKAASVLLCQVIEESNQLQECVCL